MSLKVSYKASFKRIFQNPLNKYKVIAARRKNDYHYGARKSGRRQVDDSDRRNSIKNVSALNWRKFLMNSLYCGQEGRTIPCRLLSCSKRKSPVNLFIRCEETFCTNEAEITQRGYYLFLWDLIKYLIPFLQTSNNFP